MSSSLRPGHGVALCALALLTIGVLMVNSASMQVDAATPMSLATIAQSRPAAYAGIAILAMGVCALLPVRRMFPAVVRPAVPPDEPSGKEHRFLSGAWLSQLGREYARLWPLWLSTIALVVVLASVYMPVISRPMKGSHRWVNLRLPGLESMQPSEIAKWALLVLLAWYGARFAHRMKSFWLGLAPGLAAAGAVAGFIVIEDLGTGALLAASAAVVLLAAGGRFWHFLVLAPVPLMGAVVAIVTNPYRLHRIESFVNPYLDPLGKGFHMIQSMAAVAGGQVFGRGLGHGLQKFGYLPEDTTDFLFAIICEELGIAGAALVVGLFGLLLWSIWLVVRHERIIMLKLLSLGVLTTIGVQAIINLAVVTGMGPTKGIALPLLSSGGTGWILTAAALGLVIAIDRAQAREGARLFRGTGREGGREGGRSRNNDSSMAIGVLGAVVASPALAASVPEQVVGNQTFALADEAESHGARASVEFGDAEGLSSQLPPTLPPRPLLLPPPVPPAVPGLIEAMPSDEVEALATATAPDGFLFDIAKQAEASAAKPKVVVTDAGKGWPSAQP